MFYLRAYLAEWLSACADAQQSARADAGKRGSFTQRQSRRRSAETLGSKVMSAGIQTSRLIRAAPWIAVVWLLIVAPLIFQFWPNIPQSKAQWILFVGFGPPLYVLAEELFGWLLSAKHGRAISSRGFSFARIVVALLSALVTIGTCGVLLWLVST